MVGPTIFPSIQPQGDYPGDMGHADDEEQDGVAQLTAQIDDGVCPWCEDEYENVPAHASSAHAHEWDEYTEQRD